MSYHCRENIIILFDVNKTKNLSLDYRNIHYHSFYSEIVISNE